MAVAAGKIMMMGSRMLRQIAQPFTKEEILSKETQKLLKHMESAMQMDGAVGIAGAPFLLPLLFSLSR